MRLLPGDLLLIFVLTAFAGEAGAQQWSDLPPTNYPEPGRLPEASHYGRNIGQQVAAPAEQQAPHERSAYATQSLSAEPAARSSPAFPALPIRLASAEEDIAVAQPNPVTATSEREPLRLAPRDSSSTSGTATAPSRPATSPLSAVSGVAGSLAAVLGLFMAVVWFSRRLGPPGSAPLPKEVLEMLGRAPLGPRQQMQLVRLGNKLVLLHVSSNGAEALAEVTDALEVERLSALCRRTLPGSASASFNELLTQIGGEPAPSGFVGDGRRTATPAVATRRR